MPWLLYPCGKNAQYPLDRRRVDSRAVWMWWQREKFPAPARSQTLIIQLIA